MGSTDFVASVAIHRKSRLTTRCVTSAEIKENIDTAGLRTKSSAPCERHVRVDDFRARKTEPERDTASSKPARCPSSRKPDSAWPRQQAETRLRGGAGPFPVAYCTYGTLNAERSNAVLVCHALTGDQYVAEAHPITGKPGWWDADRRPGKAARYRPLLRHLLERAGRMHRHARSDGTEPGDGRALWVELPGHHHRRHGARAGDAARPSRHRPAVLRDRRLDGRDAGARMGVAPQGPRVRRGADRRRGAPHGPEHRLPRGRPPGDHGRPGLARRRLYPSRRHSARAVSASPA